jgi:hypothetical protein
VSFSLQGAIEFVTIMDFDQHIHAERMRTGLEVRPSARHRAPRRSAGCSRRPRRGPRDLVGIDHEILAQHRQRAGRARRSLQIIGHPGRTGTSVSTDRQAAPRARSWRDLGRDRNLAQITPLDGLAFLISAMTAASPCVILARSAISNPRGFNAPVGHRAGGFSLATQGGIGNTRAPLRRLPPAWWR